MDGTIKTLQTPAAGAGTIAGAKTAPPVATGPAADQSRTVPAVAGNAKTAALEFGGSPTGRETKFNFTAGTPEGDQERRDDEAARKRAARAVARGMVAPPPLPSASTASTGASGAPLNVQTPGLVIATVEAFVPWVAADVQDTVNELVELSEAKRIDEFLTIAKEAKLPASLLKEIEKDAAYPSSCKEGLKKAIAGTIAKWLNRTGISAKNKEEGLVLFYVATIRLQGRRMKAHLLETIEEDKASRPKEKVTPPEPGTLQLPTARAA